MKLDMQGIPSIGQAVLNDCEGILCGSQAAQVFFGLPFLPDSDFDIVVPLRQWRKAARISLPYKVGTTKNGGIRLEDDGVQLDIFTDDWIRLSRYVVTYCNRDIYGVDYNSGMILKGQKV